MKRARYFQAQAEVESKEFDPGPGERVQADMWNLIEQSIEPFSKCLRKTVRRLGRLSQGTLSPLKKGEVSVPLTLYLLVMNQLFQQELKINFFIFKTT